MGYCLWLNGSKISSWEEISDNFDIHSLKSYYYGGSLIKWLCEHNGGHIAEILKSISETVDIETALKYSFGLIENISSLIHTTDNSRSSIIEENSYPDSAALSFPINSYHFYSSFPLASSAFLFNDSYRQFFPKDTLFSNSFGFNSFYMGSFSFEDFYLNSLHFGSFSLNSFYFSSFYLNSFYFSSFWLNSFFLNYFFATSFSGWFENISSFIHNAPYILGALCINEEENFIRHICSCPLNMYGYGINLI